MMTPSFVRCGCVVAALLYWVIAPIDARATLITYDFHTTSRFGLAGSFAYDDSIVPPGGGTLTAPNLLTNLTIEGFTIRSADPVTLEFDSAGNLIRASFGCSNEPTGCGPSHFWHAFAELSPAYGRFGMVVVDSVETDGVTMTRRVAPPQVVPSTIEAESFDQGGEGVGYHDATPGNQGDAGYRTSEDVDIFVSNDAAGGGRIVKNFESGEWLAYSISVPTTGRYDVEVRASTNFDFPGSSYYVQVDGVSVSGLVTLPDTGGWDNYQWLGKRTLYLTAGTHLLRIVAYAAYFSLNSIRVTSTSASTPYFGSPTAVPGEFEAEAFDAGGEGVAYHDNSPGNQGDSGLRVGEDVDTFVSNDAQSGSPYIVKNMEAGEWLDYTISVPSNGSYDVELRAATSVDFPNPAYHVEVDGVNVSGTVTLPDTGGWDSYQWIGRTTVALAAGTHVLKLVSERPYFGLNSIRLTTTGANGPTPNAVPGVIEAENFDGGGEGPGYHENTPGNQGDAGFRTSEDVDIFSSNDGGSGSWYIVKNFERGEWLAYTISVPTSGNYDVELRASTSFDFPNVYYYVQVDGSNVSGPVVLPNTGGWDHYAWIGKTTIALTAGTHLMRIVAVQPYFGFNSFRVLHHSP